MDVLYTLREGTITEILEKLESPPKRSALRSTLTKLEEKGHVTHGKRSREFVFRPAKERSQAGHSALRKVLHTFFDGSLGKALSVHFTEAKESLSKEEIAELRQFIDREEGKRKASES